MMKRFFASLSVFSLLLGASLALVPPATAQAAQCDGQVSIFPRWFEGLCKEGDGKTIMSPGDMSGGDTGEKFGRWAGKLAMNLVTILLYVVGYVSLGFIIYGGFKYMTSGDNSGGIASAQKTILNAVIGLVLSIMSVALVTFVANAI